MLPEFSLENRVYIVTGAGRGLGVALAGALVEAGARKVYCFDLLTEPHQGWHEMRKGLGEKGDRLVFKTQNVSDEEGIEVAFAEVVKGEGRLDGLVCAAGIIYIKDAIDQSAAEYKRVLETNCLGNFICCRTFARQIRSLGTKKGSIVMISSMSAHIANQGLPSFGMNSSKAAICQMARSFAVEWAPLGIRVNTLSPGYIASPLPKERYAKDPTSLKVIEAQNPMGRISTPEEYRGAAVFIMSDASSFMTGSDLIIDGGHRAW